MERLNKREIGQRIKQIRKTRKMKQWQLAEALGTTQSAVHKYEHGVIPVPERLLTIAKLGNTSVDWILTGKHAESARDEQECLPRQVFTLAVALQNLHQKDSDAIQRAVALLDAAIAVLPEHELTEARDSLTAAAQVYRAVIQLVHQEYRRSIELSSPKQLAHSADSGKTEKAPLALAASKGSRRAKSRS